ncbi:MAG: PcfK-like protein, partial [Verrucomicrobiaceae bacterium]
EEDELFAATYGNPKKSISDCCNYILNEVKKMNVQGLPSEAVYNLAVHYYDD